MVIRRSTASDNVFHTIQAGDRIDLLAYRYLGDPTLWWIICDYNDVFFPLDLDVGAVLRMPSMDRLQMSLLV